MASFVFGIISLIKATKFTTKFIRKDYAGGDAYNFYFRKPEGVEYLAGQYFRLTLPIDNPDDRGSARYFTQSSSPSEDFLRVTTRIIKSSYKLRLAKLKEGEEITYFGPFGDVFVDGSEEKPIVHLAGGIGITPARSMIKFISDKNLKTNFSLIVSFSKRQDVIFYDELQKISQERPNIKVFYTLSSDKEQNGFFSGRITQELMKKHLNNLEDSKFYLTGPEVMVKSLGDVLKEMKIKEENIIPEDFPGY